MIPLTKTWRWFGKNDAVTFNFLRQMEIKEIVTSLYHVSPGQPWSGQEIKNLKDLLGKNGLRWKIVESLPVPDSIKTHDKDYELHVNNYIKSLENLAHHGINTVCYNFMTGIDWIRTNLEYQLPSGGEVMHFDLCKFIALDVFILKRPGAEKNYTPGQIEEAELCYKKMSQSEREKLSYNVIVKTQGFIHGKKYTPLEDYRKSFLESIYNYQQITKDKLRQNLGTFLDDIMDTLQKYNIRMCIHPDDPPFPVLGMPRVVSTLDDLDWIFSHQPSILNGLTYCSGSLSANTVNDPVEMVEKYKERVHFAHLRNTLKNEKGDFFESGHLSGNLNLPEIIYILLKEQIRRKNEGRDDFLIPVRPDHGVKMLDDFQRDAPPGYPLIGRYRGLLEIAGIESGLSFMMQYE